MTPEAIMEAVKDIEDRCILRLKSALTFARTGRAACGMKEADVADALGLARELLLRHQPARDYHAAHCAGTAAR